ncbi:MAG: isochorismatase family cysteine hydrolase [Eubacteriales bacterium]|nr:cysteine hydrolase [Bacillota bacterium]MBV1727461.1 cysteine hydrolase [Desulforudis sp.]MDQ7789806.1 isochorismatase family cysteine hydrolase [Clostridia bacterium]MDZ4043648.1 isochorismatase family cysteine hydrolase [Eubacteriales bacterium]MBU4532935.1 cysteine hydrolase [Bacillota bacterium]
MGRRVLLVIDMLHDFVSPQGALFCGEAAQRIIPFVRDKVREFEHADEPIIYINDAHAEDDLEFARFPRHCVAGSEGAGLIPDVQPGNSRRDRVYTIEKRRYSGFFETNLGEILETLAPDEIHVVGVCTNICVLYTVEELRNRDLATVVYRQGMASFDEEAHTWALQQMTDVLGARIE